MRILLTNDDGINAIGLRALAAALAGAGHAVTVVAPSSEQSGVSSCLTLHSPLRVTEVDEDNAYGKSANERLKGFTVSGTPVDCVKLGVTTLLEESPDLVVSGINAGFNIGMDVFYSGTAAAAMEAAWLGYPGLAVSRGLHPGDDPAGCARITAELIERIDWANLPPQRALNLNFPRLAPQEAKGPRVCPISMSPWTACYERREDPRGRPYWWIAGVMSRPDAEPETDCALVMQGWITLSALHVDINDAALNARLENRPFFR